MKMTNTEFNLIITGLLCIILIMNIIMKLCYSNEVMDYFLNIIFFTLFGIGISDHIKKFLISE